MRPTLLTAPACEPGTPQIGDATLPRPWSKHSKGSSAHARVEAKAGAKPGTTKAVGAKAASREQVRRRPAPASSLPSPQPFPPYPPSLPLHP